MSFHTALKATPFEVVCGCKPPSFLSYLPGQARVEFVDYALQQRDQILLQLREHSLQAQNVMKAHYDVKHRDVKFEVGEMVLLKLALYRQQNIASRNNPKLSPRYYGPFKVTAKVGEVAYKLQLPDNSLIHPIFHVSSLKRFKGGSFSNTVLPPLPLDGYQPSPMAILDCRTRQGRTEVLIHWDGLSPADASWEDAEMLITRFPSCVVEDNHNLLGV